MQRLISSHRQPAQRRPRMYRPLVERLEDRLPPGDAALAGLLAGGVIPERAAGLIPAAAPEEARRLPELGDGTNDFTLLVGVTDDAAGVTVAAERQTRLDRAKHLAEEPFARPVTPVHGGVSQNGRSLQDFGSLPSSAFPSLAAGTSAVVFVPPVPANYQLDQAVAALSAPITDAQEFADPALDAGAEVQSTGVHALFNLGHPTTGPFPANMFTVPDDTHNTGRRVNLPLPDCKVYVSDCEDLAVLNELDGFNLQPRLSIPFSGPIDADSVTSATVFLVSLGSTVPGQGYMPRGTVVGINQVVWDVETNALHIESDELLAPHTRFALIVTNGVRDASGDPVEASPEFRRFRQTAPREYRRELLDAIHEARRLGVRERDIVTASVFTTQSATAVLEKIRDQIHAATPAPADFLLGPNEARTVFNLDDVAGLTWNQQTRVDGPLNAVPLDVNLLRFIPGAVGQIAFGKYVSPDYETTEQFIPPVGTRTGTPVVQGVNELFFNLYLPSGPEPADGWPVAIVGHGGGSSKQGGGPGGGASLAFAASLAEQGIASIAINAVGHGFGPLSTLTVRPSVGAPLTFSEGGRGLDQDGDGIIGPDEGIAALAPRSIIADRDGRQQTVVDLIQLVRVIDAGMDVDGDGARDLNPSRIYYMGQSLGGMYGTMFLAIEPDVRAGVLNVPGGSSIESRRRAPIFRPGIGSMLAARGPSLLNPPGLTSIGGIPVAAPHFNENLPLRNQPPVSNTVPGAMAIQEVFENTEWVSQPANPVAYAPHLRKAPLPSMTAKPVILQIAKADQVVPNPTSTAMLRAGDLADRATYYRHDLAFAENPQLPTNPHGFLSRIDIPGFRVILRGAQEQIATFFDSDGKTVIHPEPARFFEVPIVGPLPEDLNYIP